MTFGPSRPRPGGSSTHHGAPPPSPTPPPPPSWRSAPQPRHDAPRPATSQSPHPRPTDRPRPDQINARVHQQRPRPPTNPRCQPTYSTCPATAATASPNPTPRRRPCAHTRESTFARAPTPRAPPRHRTTRNPPGPPPPPVPTTPSHPPTPTPPPKTAAPPRDTGGGAGPTSSSGSCESGPGQSPPSRAWSIGPKGSVENCRLQPAGRWMPQAAWEAMLADALHPLAVHPRNLPAPQDHPYVLRRLRETLQETQRDGIRLLDITQSPTAHTHTPSLPHNRRRTDAGGTHSTPGALRATQHDGPDPPASGAAIQPLYPASHRRGAARQALPGEHQANRKRKDANAHTNRHRYAQRHRAQARNRHNHLTQPKPQHESNPSHTPKPLTLDP